MSPEYTDAAVVCADVSRVYNQRQSRFLGTGADPVTALSDVSLSVSPGEVVGIAGPSGSGKSTLLHLIAGLDSPTDGKITVDGVDVSNLSGRQRTKFRLEHVGLIFQRFYLLPSLSARGNVALPLVEQGVRKRKRRDRAEELLEQVGLGDRMTHRPGKLSGGEQQRVAIARALAADPALIIADEPTGELDTETGNRVLEVLVQDHSERAIVLASHDEETLAKADRVVQLVDGKRVE